MLIECDASHQQLHTPIHSDISNIHPKFTLLPRVKYLHIQENIWILHLNDFGQLLLQQCFQ